jgi:type IV pilus assembly protein PilV
MKRGRRFTRGFTLIEALIGMVILSIGLLGAAVMLLESVRTHARALRAVTASGLVRDMAERIRANPDGRANYALADIAAAASSCDARAGCDSAALASMDLAHFAASVRAAFPRADTHAQIEFEPAIGLSPAHRYVITLRWHDARDAEDSLDTVALQLVVPASPSGPVAG